MPKRILVLSANMGEGHNAAARLIADAARQIWPGCEVRTLDTLELRGRRFSRACQSAYDFDLRRMPWLYQYFYASLIKHPWFAWASKRLVGSFFGRRLLGEVRRFRPDLVVSTYPLGSAAIDWARRARGLSRPTATFVPAFDIHPFWVYKGIDLNLVMHPALVEAFRATGVREQVLVGAPLVRVAFGPGDPVVARREVGLEPDRFVVLLTGGAWGVGSLERAVRELLAVDAPLQIVVVCGTNERLRARLEALKAPRDRLMPHGLVDTMPELMRAADAVVTNGAGVTVLETLATGRALIAFDPIAGHGRAAAAELERLGLAVVCRGPAELRAAVETLAAERGLRGGMPAGRASEANLVLRPVSGDLERLAAIAPPELPPWRRPVRILVRAAVAAAVAFALFVPLSYVAGTRLVHAARGAPTSSGEVAIAVAGQLSPQLLQGIDSVATTEGIPITVFVQGSDAARWPALVEAMATNGVDVESGMWAACRDNTVEPGDARAEFNLAIDAVTAALHRRPRYVAEPCGQLSLLAVAVVDDLPVRPVVFAVRISVAGSAAPDIPALPAGRIIEVTVAEEASPEAVMATLRGLAAAAAREGLRPVSVPSIDGVSEPASSTL